MPIGKTVIKLNQIFVLSTIAIGVVSVHTFNLSHPVLATEQEEQKKCPAGSLRANRVVNTYAECNIDPKNSNDDLMGTVTTIINVIVGLVGIIAVIVIVVGGMCFCTKNHHKLPRFAVIPNALLVI